MKRTRVARVALFGLGSILCLGVSIGWVEGWNAKTLRLAVLPEATTWHGMALEAPPCFVIDEHPDQVHVRSGLFCFAPRIPPGVRWLSFFERPDREVVSYVDWNPCENAVGSCEKYLDTVAGIPVECFREMRQGRSAVRINGCRAMDAGFAYDYTCAGDLCDRLSAVVVHALRSYRERSPTPGA